MTAIVTFPQILPTSLVPGYCARREGTSLMITGVVGFGVSVALGDPIGATLCALVGLAGLVLCKIVLGSRRDPAGIQVHTSLLAQSRRVLPLMVRRATLKRVVEAVKPLAPVAMVTRLAIHTGLPEPTRRAGTERHRGLLAPVGL